MAARRAIFIAPFEELSEPRLVAELAARAEARGLGRVLRLGPLHLSPPGGRCADPWVTLAAVAMATERVTIGTLVTPLPRRRPHQLARETATLDRLSGGRLVLGVGLGSDRTGEFAPERLWRGGRAEGPGAGCSTTGWSASARTGTASSSRGRCDGRSRSGWPPTGRTGARSRRAARHDGLFPVDMPGPEALAELRGELRRRLRVRGHEPGRAPTRAVDRRRRDVVSGRLRPAARRPRCARRSTPRDAPG